MARRIHPSALKHGVTDDDIDHAIRFALAVADLDEGDDEKVIYIGPDRSGNLLEVIERSGFLVHAMPLRKRYETLLRGFGVTYD